MHVVKCKDELFYYLGSLLFVKTLHLLDHVKEITTRNQLHNDIIAAFIF